MKIDIEGLLRPNILKLKPYRSARDDYDSGILLDANENSFGSSIPDTNDLHRYPSPLHLDLKKKIANFRQVQENEIFLGVGSDEPIDLLIRMFCRPGLDQIMITPPTYGMYKVSADINDVESISAPLNPEFQLQTDLIFQSKTENTKILFLCSPNNPTGNDLDIQSIEQLLHSFDGIVVLDEAYIDFSERDSFANRIHEFNNLVVLQTVSKSFGLAGIRLGIAIANPTIIDFMNRVKAPYNINKLTAQVAHDAFSDTSSMENKVHQVLDERAFLIQELAQFPEVEHIYPTDANFVLIRIPDALNIYKRLPDLGVVIRYRGDQLHCENTLRITVGTRKENVFLLEQLKKLLS